MKLFIFISAMLLVLQCNEKEQQVNDSINDFWVLDALTNFDYNLDGNKGRPTLEIHLNDSTYLGYSGCNNYQGDLVLDNYNIDLLPAISTRMFCDNNGLEQSFFDALQNADSYSINALKLSLLKGKEVLATFKKLH